MLQRTAFVLGLAFGIAAMTPAFADEPMTSKQIMKLTPGTFHAVVKGRFQLIVTLTRDGTAVGKAQGLEDRGRWTVKNDQLCISLPTWTRGRLECSAVVADNGWYRSRSVSFKRL